MLILCTQKLCFRHDMAIKPIKQQQVSTSTFFITLKYVTKAPTLGQNNMLWPWDNCGYWETSSRLWCAQLCLSFPMSSPLYLSHLHTSSVSCLQGWLMEAIRICCQWIWYKLFQADLCTPPCFASCSHSFSCPFWMFVALLLQESLL